MAGFVITMFTFSPADLPDYSKITFPETDPVPLGEILSEDGGPSASHLFTQFIRYDSAKRMTARDALSHPFFWEDPRPAAPSDMPIPKAKTNTTLDLKVDLTLQEITKDLNNLL